MKHLYPALFAAACLLAGTTALAERADRDKPLTIDADALRHDDQKQITVFTGRVTANKGTIAMRGARLEVRQDAAGNQFGILTAEPGQRAFFRQKREGLDEYIEGEAEQVEYDSTTDTARLMRKAELRRYQGTTVADEVFGTLIVYNGTTEVFTVDGQPGPGGRVRAILAPRHAASAAARPASAAASAPKASASQPGPALRPSGSLAGERQ
ncbi:MAG: lipopolysaccharide transport periplasmic protein LptA [Burkholderiaceae bacterium]|jgi:lipopolysaccharide export system protein LptA